MPGFKIHGESQEDLFLSEWGGGAGEMGSSQSTYCSCRDLSSRYPEPISCGFQLPAPLSLGGPNTSGLGGHPQSHGQFLTST